MSTVHGNDSSYLDAPYGLAAWLLTKDHKRIAMLYLISITIFFAVGGLFAAGIRLELLTPKGDLWSPDMYNKLFTLHGVVMIFFFLIPSIPATLGNFLHADHVRHEGPRVPADQPAQLVHLRHRRASSRSRAVVRRRRSTRAGRSTRRTARMSSTDERDDSRRSASFVAGFSSILTGFNFIVTVHRMRAPGLTWFRLPLFVWAQYATSLVMILGTPVIAITVAARGGRARAAASASSIRSSAATRCSSSTCSGSTRTRPSTS